MIIITGAGGFIGSVVLGYFNQQGITDIMLIDDLPYEDQFKNLSGKTYRGLRSVDDIPWAAKDVDCVIHLGANSNTLERNWDQIYKDNVISTIQWSEFCKRNSTPMIFASSAAVYGNGRGPLNHYAFSKQLCEKEIDAVTLRLFNVYGPNEYHKGRMASVIYHWHTQLATEGNIRVFDRSNEYLRDFVWVEDVARTIYHFYKNYCPGVYDLGTGVSVDFDTVADLVAAENKIYIAMPEDLRAQYQTRTCADTTALIKQGVPVEEFLTVEQAVPRYLEYLESKTFY